MFKKKKVYRTEKAKSVIDFLDAHCPADDEQADERTAEQLIIELNESIGLWNDMLHDALDLLDRFEGTDKADSIRDDIRSCRAHMQECKLKLRELKADMRNISNSVTPEIKMEGFDLTA